MPGRQLGSPPPCHQSTKEPLQALKQDTAGSDLPKNMDVGEQAHIQSLNMGRLGCWGIL